MYRINNNDFKILGKYKNFLDELDDCLENVPRKDMYFKDKMRNISYDVLYLIIRCSYENSNDEVLNIYASLKAEIAMLDFFIDRLFSKKYMSEKKAYKLAGFLVEINKMLSSFISNKVNNAC